MKHEADVFVVGGGPAGLAAAIALRAKGLRVTVADGAKPPIAKTCGEGLLPDALKMLRRLGVVFGAADGYVLRGIRFQDEASSVGAEFPEGFGLGVRREVLHRRLMERAEECGVGLLWNAPVSRIFDEGVTVGGKDLTARFVVGADGIRSRVRRWAGLEHRARTNSRFAHRQRFRARPWSDLAEVHWHGDAQVYVTPVGSEEVCLALISRRPHLHLDAALQRFPILARKLTGAVPSSEERGAVTSMCRLPRVTHGNVALVGDASGTVDAITAEGLSLGFQQGFALAEAIASGSLEPYEREHHRLLRRTRFMGQVLLFLAAREEIRKRTFQTLQAAPDIFKCMLAYHVGETRPLELAANGAQFSWRFLTA